MDLKLKNSAMVARPPVGMNYKNMWFGFYPSHMFFYTSWRCLLKNKLAFSETQLKY
jgi:hypothetical protein